jgi:hypothetical protein
MQTTTSKVNVFTTTAQSASKMHDYRAHLRTITNGLVDMAKAAGRTHFTNNQLLRECYNLIDAELMTYEQWKEQGAYVRRGEHAYLFWGSPIISESGVRYCPVEFKFCRAQVRFKN